MMMSVSILLSAILAAAPPLTDDQRTAVEDVTDRVANIDEAGLYALLRNAEAWPDRVGEAIPGAMIPDPRSLRDDPGAARGEMFLIEGELESMAEPGIYTPRRVLAQPGWDHVEVWHVRLDDGTLAIVCLTDPPDVAARGVEGQRVPNIARLTLRIPARFYKLINAMGQDARPTMRTYPVFVGKAAQLTGGAAPSRDASGLNALPYALLFAAVIVLLLVFGYVRAKAKRPSRLDERLAQRQAADREEYAVRTDLPEDPAAALETLEREHELAPPETTDPPDKDAPAHGDRQHPTPPPWL